MFVSSFFPFTNILKNVPEHCHCIHGKLLLFSSVLPISLSYPLHECLVLFLGSFKERQQHRLVHSWRAFGKP